MTRSIFDASGAWEHDILVPSGLSGLQISFSVFGQAQTGNTLLSNRTARSDLVGAPIAD